MFANLAVLNTRKPSLTGDEITTGQKEETKSPLESSNNNTSSGSWELKSPRQGIANDVLLNSLEQTSTDDNNQSRERTKTMYTDSSLNRPPKSSSMPSRSPRNRKASLDYSETAGAFENNAISPFETLYKIYDYLEPKISKRLHWYSYGFLFMAIICITRQFESIQEWLAMFGSTVLLDITTFLLDELFFCLVIDRIFIDRYDTAYLLHSFNGPLGLIAMLVIVELYFNSLFKATNLFPNYRQFKDGVAIVLILLCVKQFYVRKNYIRLLEKRFEERVFKLETYSILLSELATVKPPKRFCTVVGDNASSVGTNRESSGMMRYSDPFFKTINKVQGVFSDLVAATSENSIETRPRAGGRNRSGTILFDGIPPQMEAFSCSGGSTSGGGATTKEHFRNRAYSSVGATLGFSPEPQRIPVYDPEKEEKLKKVEELADIRKRKTFWQSASKLSANSGTLCISTYNGMVFIRKRVQAKDFGKTLYKHLSRKGKIILTPKVIEALLFEMHHPEALFDNGTMRGGGYNDGDIEMGVRGGGGGDRVNTGDNNSNSDYYPPPQLTDEEKEHDLLFYTTAMELFDPFKTGVITEQQIVDGLLLIYREQRFAASSLNDYGEIHQSLHNVITVLFWALIIVLLQIFLKIDLAAYILPFITVLVTVSFALGPLIGNLFLSCTFVFFMLPFDIGNRVVIGADANKITAFVRGVSLLYTTFITTDNRIVKIPNHLLFHEKIFNLVESSGMVFQFDVHFNITDYSGGKNNNNKQNKAFEHPVEVLPAPYVEKYRRAHPVIALIDREDEENELGHRPLTPPSQATSLTATTATTVAAAFASSATPAVNTTRPPRPPPLNMPSAPTSSSAAAASVAASDASSTSPAIAASQNQAKITQLVERVKTWMLVEHKDEWGEAYFYCSNIDTVNNSIVYSMWAVHRDNWAHVLKPLDSRTKLLMYIRELQIEMGLVFVKIPQAVSLSFTHHHQQQQQGNRSQSPDQGESQGGNAGVEQQAVTVDDTEHLLRELAVANRNAVRQRGTTTAAVTAGSSASGVAATTASAPSKLDTLVEAAVGHEIDESECGDVESIGIAGKGKMN